MLGLTPDGTPSFAVLSDGTILFLIAPYAPGTAQDSHPDEDRPPTSLGVGYLRVNPVKETSTQKDDAACPWSHS